MALVADWRRAWLFAATEERPRVGVSVRWMNHAALVGLLAGLTGRGCRHAPRLIVLYGAGLFPRMACGCR